MTREDEGSMEAESERETRGWGAFDARETWPGDPPADRGSLKARIEGGVSGASSPGRRELWEVRLPVPSRGRTSPLEPSRKTRDPTKSVRADWIPLGSLSRVLARALPEASGPRNGALPKSDSEADLAVYVVAGTVGGLPVGTYRYMWQEHALLPMASGDRREQLARQGSLDSWIGKAPAIVVLSVPKSGADPATGSGEASEDRGDDAAPRQPEDIPTMADRVERCARSMGLGASRYDEFDADGVRRALDVATGAKPRVILALGHSSPQTPPAS